MLENSPTGDTSPPSQQEDDNTNTTTMLPLNIPYHLRNAEAVHEAMLKEAKEYHDNLRLQAEAVLAKHFLQERLGAAKVTYEVNAERVRLEKEISAVEKQMVELDVSVLEAKTELQVSQKKRAAAQIRAQKATEEANALKSLVKASLPASTPAPAVASINQPTATPQPVSNPATEQPANRSAPQPLPTIRIQDQPGTATSGPLTPPPTAPSEPILIKLNVNPRPAAAPGGALAPATQATSAPLPAPPTEQATPAPAVPAVTVAQPVTGMTNMVDQPDTQRYVSIHAQLKRLRNQIKPKGKQNTSPLKEEAMKQGAAIRIAIGQLSGAGKNAVIFNKIRDIMMASMHYKITSPSGVQLLTIDPTPYIVRVPEPLDDPNAKNNGPKLPVLFIYLLSVFSKALVAQAAQEAAQKPESAEPIALAAHQIFSHPELLWRGMSMIDILICKLRKSCGALFGFRGSETTDAGRVTLGWKKEDGVWIAEQFHYDRMRGIGAFYAGLTLRLYKNRVNPYPPHNYWRAMAAIISCPQQERSNTSYYVLCALIQGYEQKFLQFYGDMARSALEAALIQYPKGAWDPKNVAVVTLKTLGEKIQKNGLHLPE